MTRQRGRLQFAAHRQDLGRRLKTARQAQRRRCIAARTPDETDLAVHLADDEIIDAVGDVAVMNQGVGRNPAQPVHRLGVSNKLRFVGDIAAGHDRGPVQIAEHQKVQGRRREHEAQHVQAWRHRIGEMLRPAGAQQNDGRFRAHQSGLLRFADAAIAPDDIEVARHQRERLGIAPLALAEPGNGMPCSWHRRRADSRRAL